MPQVNVPLHSCEHFYIVTKPIGVPRMLPVLRDPDGKIYVREWSGGLMGGGFELQSKPCFHEGIPSNFEFQLLPEDWPHFGMLDCITQNVSQNNSSTCPHQVSVDTSRYCIYCDTHADQH